MGGALELGWLVWADGLLAVAFWAIAAALMRFRRKRHHLPYPRLLLLFSVFILLCGVNHSWRVYMAWGGGLGAYSVIAASTALVGLASAIGLLRIIPQALTVPSITELRQAMESANNEKLERLAIKARYDSEYHLREAANASPLGLMVMDSYGVITMANSASCRVFGYADGELVGQTIDTVIDFSAESSGRKTLEEFFSPDADSGIDVSECVARGIHCSGYQIPIEVKLIKRNDPEGIKVFASVTDISERLNAQHKMQAMHARIERISAAAREGLWEWAIDSDTLWWSSAFWQLLGYQREPRETSMNLWEAHIAPEFQAVFFTQLQNAIDHKKTFDVEFIGSTVNRQSRWFRVHGKFVAAGETGEGVMCGTLEDIQQRKDMALQLSEKNQFLESIFTGTNYGVFVLDCLSDGTIHYKSVNPAIETSLGVNAAQLIGKTTAVLAPEVFSEAMAEQVDSRYQRCRQTGKPITYIESFSLRGRPTWWKTSLYPLMNDAGETYRIIGSSTDVTELKATENKLAESQQFLQNVVDLAICGLYIYDLASDSNIFVNRQYTRITGYTKEELNSMDDLSVLFHPDEIDSINQQVKKAMSLTSQAFLEIEYRFWHKEGYWIWCYAFDSVYARDERGRPTQLLGTFIDVSQLKQYSEQLQNLSLSPTTKH
jgi:PAS domain S-box-containing protein